MATPGAVDNSGRQNSFQVTGTQWDEQERLTREHSDLLSCGPKDAGYQSSLQEKRCCTQTKDGERTRKRCEVDRDKDGRLGETRDGKGDKDSVVTTEFNVANQITGESIITPNTMDVYSYEYDKDGHIIKEILAHRSRGRDSLCGGFYEVQTAVHTYDKKGHLTKTDIEVARDEELEADENGINKTQCVVRHYTRNLLTRLPPAVQRFIQGTPNANEADRVSSYLIGDRIAEWGSAVYQGKQLYWTQNNSNYGVGIYIIGDRSSLANIFRYFDTLPTKKKFGVLAGFESDGSLNLNPTDNNAIDSIKQIPKIWAVKRLGGNPASWTEVKVEAAKK